MRALVPTRRSFVRLIAPLIVPSTMTGSLPLTVPSTVTFGPKNVPWNAGCDSPGLGCGRGGAGGEESLENSAIGARAYSGPRLVGTGVIGESVVGSG